jgi:hypothetical protein
MWLLPDLTPKETFEVMRDVLSLGMAESYREYRRANVLTQATAAC